MGLSRISLRDSAVSRIKVISFGERVDIPNMCGAVKGFMPKKSLLLEKKEAMCGVSAEIFCYEQSLFS